MENFTDAIEIRSQLGDGGSLTLPAAEYSRSTLGTWCCFLVDGKAKKAQSVLCLLGKYEQIEQIDRHCGLKA